MVGGGLTLLLLLFLVKLYVAKSEIFFRSTYLQANVENVEESSFVFINTVIGVAGAFKGLYIIHIISSYFLKRRKINVQV